MVKARSTGRDEPPGITPTDSGGIPQGTFRGGVGNVIGRDDKFTIEHKIHIASKEVSLLGFSGV